MKKNLFYFSLLITSAFAVCSCSKNQTTCYECQRWIPASPDAYTDWGCYTDDEWDKMNVTDSNGRVIDKNIYCRKK